MNERREVPLWCLDRVGVVEYDGDGVPVVLRRRCINRRCCSRKDGLAAVHRFTLYGVQNGKPVGDYSTEYVPIRSANE